MRHKMKIYCNQMNISGLELREARKKKKITQEDLAKKLGVTRQTVVGYENNEVIPETKMSLIRQVLFDTNTTTNKDPGYKGIEFYNDIDVTGGNDNLFDDARHTPTGYIYIPNFEDCDKAFPLYGDSMYPKYQAGQIILCKEFTEWRDFVPYGEVFLIVTDTLRMVKYVKKAATLENYLLVSENDFFEDFEVPKHRIRRMYLVKGAIHRNMI